MQATLPIAPLRPTRSHRQPLITFERVHDEDGLAAADSLLQGYGRSLRQQYREEPELAELIAEGLGWRQPDGSLAVDWQPPLGRLLLAWVDAEPAGCVALRPRAHGGGFAGEIKRLYVRDAFRGLGVARLLLHRIGREARQAGYRRLLLETGDRMDAARRLYRSAGFEPIPPYRRLPGDLTHRFQAMCLVLD